MDRNWMYGNRTTTKFLDGIDEFSRCAQQHQKRSGQRKIYCPCRDCCNLKMFDNINVIEEHLFKRGFKQQYKTWYWHGETLVPSVDDIENDVNSDESAHEDSSQSSDTGEEEEEVNRVEEMLDVMEERRNLRPVMFERVDKAVETPLYPGCTKYSKLTAVLTLFNMKAKFGWTDTSFTALLECLRDMLPDGNDIPDSTYQAKKLMCPLGLDYTRIEACPNDCILYRNEYASLEQCPKCSESRYKRKGDKKGPAAKVLWYLPIIPRFERLFSIKSEAKNLRWHAEGRKVDGMLRHPADSPQWRAIDKKFPVFGTEVRNLRLALCTDGMNPYRTLSTQHSTWPVLLAIYNLPPWLCMKRKYIMLSLLISGPKQPGNDIDVYLAPLIDDLKLLWEEGVPVFDAYSNTKFTLRAMLFCTINDFPAYGNLSGYKVKGKQPCPICEDDMVPTRLHYCSKHVYMNHRRFLRRDHPYRRKKKQFNGSVEERESRIPLSGIEVYERIRNVDTIYGKWNKTKKNDGLWKKVSILWDLPYWKHLSVRHCLDVMHIEKNVCDAIVGTLLNIPGKTKDGVNVRKDMQKKQIRPDLWPEFRENGKKMALPPACYMLTKQEKKIFCECLYGIKVPSGYSSNVRRLVSMADYKLVGMKSHDCHMMMQVFLPIAIRGILPKHVRHIITKLCLFFNTICSKVLDPEKLDSLQADIVETLCRFEMFFPPSFFDIMVHLIVHLVREIKLCGPVFLRYMYPFERYMGTLKDKAKNPARPEGSIIQNFNAEEIAKHCEEYMKGVTQPIGLPKSRHEGRLGGNGTIGYKVISPPSERKNKAHLCVLQHLSEVQPYIDEHLNELKGKRRWLTERVLMHEHNRTFSTWFYNKVRDQLKEADHNVSDSIRWLSRGPRLCVESYEGYDINGFSFYTSCQDGKSVLQNSGVMVVASSRVYASAKDRNPINSTEAYYGVIEEIWELDYHEFRVPIFRCKWVDNTRGKKVDDYGFTLVDFNRLREGDEPFVIASQAKQVFYINDNIDRQWRVVVQGKRRILGIDDVFDEEEFDQLDDMPPLSVGVDPMPVGEDLDANYMRSDVDREEWITVVNPDE